MTSYRTELSRQYFIEAAHRLPNVPAGHKCARLHGHSFKITLHISGDIDSSLGWVVDFGEVDRAWQPIHEALDHRFLNDIEGLENPTSERLAQWIFERVKLPKGKLRAVAIAETCYAECTVFSDSNE